MKVLNLKINKTIIIWCVVIAVLIGIIIFLISSNKEIHMNTMNYTTILRDAHQDVSKYLGREITTSGYIFRGKDFEKKQFVIARDMLISENESNIVGFLCSYDQANDFENNEWVEATGILTLGDYYGPIPVIKINSIHKISTPNDVFVPIPR